MGAKAAGGRFADFIGKRDWVKMVTELNTELTAIKEMPEMPDKKAVAGSSQPADHVGSACCTESAALAMTLLLAMTVAPVAGAQSGRATEDAWLTGTRLERQLDTPVALLQWSGNPLREALNRLGRSQRVAVFLDRRIDPDQPIEFSAQNEPLSDLIGRLAASLRIGVCRVGPVIYFGPPQTAAVLGTVVEIRAEQLRQSSLPTAARLRVSRPVSWPQLTTPRELIEQTARAAGLEVNGLDQIPHDLWPATDLPPLDFAEHMSLLLAGFGLTFAWVDDGRGIRFEPLPESASLDRSYRMSSGQAAAIAQLLRQKFPQSQIAQRPDGVIIRGPIEVHRNVERWIRGDRTSTTRPKAGADLVRYTLEIKNKPVGTIAKALAKQLGLQIQFDPAIQDRLEDRVSFKVEEVTRDELLDALLKPVDLAFRVENGTLVIVAPTTDR
jgi:hypothetical protein